VTVTPVVVLTVGFCAWAWADSESGATRAAPDTTGGCAEAVRPRAGGWTVTDPLVTTDGAGTELLRGSDPGVTVASKDTAGVWTCAASARTPGEAVVPIFGVGA
jgi:hypothetical protein